MTLSRPIAFVLNGRPVRAEGASPVTTLLDWLRGAARLRGTKEGCAEGDCGACSVVIERAGPDGQIERQAVNSCLMLLGQVDGLGVRTVEGLQQPDGRPHPVQERIALDGGTQCGFCTPGFVMSAYALLSESRAPDEERIHDALAGNLCRCTGYRPIVEAIRAIGCLPESHDKALHETLAGQVPAGGCFRGAGAVFHQPATIDELLSLRDAYPDAVLLAGGTDLGLLASRERTPPRAVIHLARVAELTALRETAQGLEIGAAVTYTKAMPALLRHVPSLHAYLSRLGSVQIRNAGTIGGNLGTASPIGDMLPLLLALDASVRLHSRASGTRLRAVADFITGYRRTALAATEVIGSVLIPRPEAGREIVLEKVSRRRDQDISALALAVALTRRDGLMCDVRVAMGGMASRPMRAPHVEAALEGLRPEPAVLDRAALAVPQDFQPMNDLRGSAGYRLAVAGNLLRRLSWRLAGQDALVELDAL